MNEPLTLEEIEDRLVALETAVNELLRLQVPHESFLEARHRDFIARAREHKGSEKEQKA